MTSRLLVRMTAPLVAMSVLLLVVGVGAAWYVHHLQSRVSAELKANVSSLRAAEELVITLQEIRTLLDHFLLTGEEKYLDAVPPLRARTEKWLAEAERWGTGSNEREMMRQARRGHEQFFAEMKQLTAKPDASLERKIKRLIDQVFVREMMQPAQEYLEAERGGVGGIHQRESGIRPVVDRRLVIAGNQRFGGRLDRRVRFRPRLPAFAGATESADSCRSRPFGGGRGSRDFFQHGRSARNGECAAHDCRTNRRGRRTLAAKRARGVALRATGSPGTDGCRHGARVAQSLDVDEDSRSDSPGEGRGGPDEGRGGGDKDTESSSPLAACGPSRLFKVGTSSCLRRKSRGWSG